MTMMSNMMEKVIDSTGGSYGFVTTLQVILGICKDIADDDSGSFFLLDTRKSIPSREAFERPSPHFEAATAQAPATVGCTVYSL